MSISWAATRTWSPALRTLPSRIVPTFSSRPISAMLLSACFPPLLSGPANPGYSAPTYGIAGMMPYTRTEV
jgi:hypothetical protein